MPGKVKVKIISGKNLPVMDRSSDTTDAYVEIKLGNTTYKTDVCRRTLHPHWNTDWYRFEVDDSELQDEPLQIRLMDHDTYSANDAIGKVYLNLNPLLLPVAGQLAIGDNNPHHEISGWIPVYDTMHGIRGEVNVTVKVELFSDFNRYRQSSCGVYFFYSPTVPQGYQAKIINGFVEELIVDDDPEYQWIDKIRTPRASNEARQTLFFKLSGELQRKIGVKALNLGGNAVIGYRQSFDLEGESGIVARGIGTAVTLVKAYNIHPVVVETKEEDIQNYLKFVGDGKSFSLCSASPFHKFHFPFSPFKPFTSFDVTSITKKAPPLTLAPSVSNPNLHENNKTSIKMLLNQEDKRGESTMARRFQKFKHSQKSLSKKMIALKAKLNDSIGEEADEDLSTATIDKRKYFKRTSSDSSAMAEILARSVIHATNSLSCILENQNVSKEDDTMQKLEPIANLLSKTESETSIIDDNISDAQSYSSSDSSSSCSDYEYRYYGKSSNDMETISNIITNVEKLQRCLSREGLHKQHSMPAIPTKGYSLSSLDSIGKFETSNDFNEYKEISMKPRDLDRFSLANTSSNFPNQDSHNNICFNTRSENQEAPSLDNHGNTKKIDLQTMMFERTSTEQNIKNVSKQEQNYQEINQGKPNTNCKTSMENLHSEPTGIVKTALQTILFERANILGTPEKILENKDADFRDLLGANPFVYPNIEDENVVSEGINTTEPKQKNVIKTALQTMLLERVNLLGTPTQELSKDDITFSTCQDFKKGEITAPQIFNNRTTVASKSEKNMVNEPQTMVKSVFQTVPFKNASMMGTPTDDGKNENHDFPNALQTRKEENLKQFHHILSLKGNVDLEPKSIVNTALQTMLFERANILGTATERSVENTQSHQEFQKNHKGTMIPMTENAKIDEIKGDELVNTQYITMKHYKDTKNKEETPHLLVGNKTLQEVPTSPVPYTPDKVNKIKAIAPVNQENISIEPNKMVKTAMQTMLLEKVSILGTYTPPTSPNLSVDGSTFEKKKHFTFNEPTNLGKKTKIPKSFSSASFGEHDRQRKKDTVLGMPFTSLSSLTSEYEKYFKKDRIGCLSDSHLHKPMIETLKDKDSARKKHFKFLHTKSSNNGKPGGMFNKFLRHSKKNLPEEDFQKEVAKEHHKNILSRMFHLHHEEKSIKDEETQTSNEILSQSMHPLISEINQTPINTFKTEISSPKPPSNTDIASGDFLAPSKTKLACITSNRHSSPARDKQEQNGIDKKNEHSPDSTLKVSHSPAKVNYMVPLHRRSSDSDLSITPKGNSLTGSDRSVGNAAAYFMRNNYVRKGLLNQENFEMLEYPFLTMTKFSPRFIVKIGGSISARSVKLLERILNPEEPESRDIWWSEIRMEIRSHARSLNCNAVLGYTESTSICEDVCVLSACGTAAVVDLNYSMSDEDNILNAQRNMEKDKNLNGHHKSSHDSPDHREHFIPTCTITHLSYDEKTVPVKAKVTKCPMCLKGKVPEVLIATIEPSESIPNIGKGCFIESHVSRPLKDLRGETIAKEISDGLPFLEYELHRLLVNKLKIRGMNAIFSLKIRITVGEKMLVGVATGTAIYLSSLPTPDLPMLVTDRVSEEKKVADLQEMLKETVKRNREIYQIKDDNQNKPISDDDSDDEQASLDISCGNKDCCILEMDDPEDAEVLNLLMEENIPDGFHVVSTESVPGLEDLEIVKNLQMFTQIYRAKLTPPYNLQKHFVRLLQSVYFKLRRMVPCALCDLQFRVDLPEPDEIQLCVIGMALGLGKKIKKPKPVVLPKKPEEDLMFKLDEDPQESSTLLISKSNPSSLKYRGQRSPSKYKTQSLKQRHIPYNERHGVDITPLSYVPGANIEQYLGNLNFFFIRETTSIREEGGLSGFIHSFITEVLAIVRSHVTALGGNALVAFFMTECVLNHNLHKNQGQCLINVGGDVVSLNFEIYYGSPVPDSSTFASVEQALTLG